MTSPSLAKRMTSTYATWRWCCNAFSMPDSGRTLRRRDSSMPRPNTAAMQSALTDCTSCPPRWTRSATLHSRPMSANFEVFLVWWTIMLDSCRICRQRCIRSTDCCSTAPLGTGLMPALLLSTKWNVKSDLTWCWRISTRIYRFMWQVMPRPAAWALFFLTPCLTEQSGPSPLLLARWTPQSRITARLTRKPLVLCGASKSFIHICTVDASRSSQIISRWQRSSAQSKICRPWQPLACSGMLSFSPDTSMTLSTGRQVTMATPTDCLACPSTVLPQKPTPTATPLIRFTCHSSILCLWLPSKFAEKLAATRPWLQCTKLSRPVTSAPALTTGRTTIDAPSSLHIKDVFCGVHASSFHPACNGMSWTSFTVRTAALCARRNSLAAMCGGRRLTTTSSPVSPRAATATSTVTRHWRVLVGGVDEVAKWTRVMFGIRCWRVLHWTLIPTEGSETGCLNELVTFLFSPLACLLWHHDFLSVYLCLYSLTD